MGKHGKHEAPQYVVLATTGAAALPPPPPIHPRYHSSDDSTWCCLCCYCCCYCFFILVIIAAFIASFVFLNPKPPLYTIDHLSITSFDVSSDFSTIHTKLSITVRAENPNDKIGIFYGQNSNIRLAYRGVDLCTGKWPSFYQGYLNTTVVKIAMDGLTKLNQETQDALHSDQQRGQIPVNVFVMVPVQLRIVERDMNAVIVSARCELVVDNLEHNKKAGIKMAECHVEW